MMKRLILGVIGFLFILMMPSCLEYGGDEELFIMDDGSGVALFRVPFDSIPKEVTVVEVMKPLMELAQKDKGITSFHVQVGPHIVKKVHYLHVTVGFRTLNDLADYVEDAALLVKKQLPQEPYLSTSPVMDWRIARWDTGKALRKVTPEVGHVWNIHYGVPTIDDLAKGHQNQLVTGQVKSLGIDDVRDGYLCFEVPLWHVVPKNTVVGLGGALVGALLATLIYLIKKRYKSSLTLEKKKDKK